MLRTRSAVVERLGGDVPGEMVETHHLQDGGRLTTSAAYGGVRLFDVQTGDVERPQG